MGLASIVKRRRLFEDLVKFYYENFEKVGKEVKSQMCRCCCKLERHHHHEHEHHMGFPWPIMSIEEKIKMLEEYREALTKRIEKINKRLEALKR